VEPINLPRLDPKIVHRTRGESKKQMYLIFDLSGQLFSLTCVLVVQFEFKLAAYTNYELVSRVIFNLESLHL